MWRYAPVMPLKDGEAPVSLGEGLTPMHDLPKLARQVGVARLWVKDEGLVDSTCRAWSSRPRATPARR
jgi:threonine synthase